MLVIVGCYTPSKKQDYRVWDYYKQYLFELPFKVQNKVWQTTNLGYDTELTMLEQEQELLKAGYDTKLYKMDDTVKYIWIVAQKNDSRYYFVIINNQADDSKKTAFELQACYETLILVTHYFNIGDFLLFEYLFPIFVVRSKKEIDLRNNTATEYSIDWSFEEFCDFYIQTGMLNFEIGENSINFVGKGSLLGRLVDSVTVEIEIKYIEEDGINKIIVKASSIDGQPLPV
jgi:hypothetical protein